VRWILLFAERADSPQHLLHPSRIAADNGRWSRQIRGDRQSNRNYRGHHRVWRLPITHIPSRSCGRHQASPSMSFLLHGHSVSHLLHSIRHRLRLSCPLGCAKEKDHIIRMEQSRRYFEGEMSNGLKLLWIEQRGR